MTTIDLPPSSVRHDARIIGLVGLAHSVSHFFHMILAPLFPWIKEEFQLSYAELGLLMTVFFIVSGIAQALSGFAVDHFGARRVLFFGISLLALAALLLSSAQSYAMLIAGAMLAGVGNGTFHPSDYTLLNQKVSAARLGHAFSVHGVSGNLGWAAAPIFLVTIAQLSTWRTAIFCAACLPLLVLAILYAQRDLLASPVVARSASASPAAATLGFMKIPAVWMCFGFFFLIAMALGGIQSFSSHGLRQLYGMSLNAATSAYTAYMLASAAGMLWGGHLASKTSDHDRTIMFAFGSAGLFSLLLASGFGNATLAWLLMAAIGFGSGVAGPSRDLLIRAAAPKNATGRVYGLVYSGLDSGLAVAPLLFGLLMDAHHPAGLFFCVGLFQVLAILTAVKVGGRTRALAA